MDAGLSQVVVAAVAFVGSHFLLSHPLRAPLVRAVGQGGFMGLYVVVAFATLGWLASSYRAARRACRCGRSARASGGR